MVPMYVKFWSTPIPICEQYSELKKYNITGEVFVARIAVYYKTNSNQRLRISYPNKEINKNMILVNYYSSIAIMDECRGGWVQSQDRPYEI
jgi:hypothetical protein